MTVMAAAHLSMRRCTAASVRPDEAPQETGNTTQWVVFFSAEQARIPRQDRLGVCFIAFAR